MCAVLLNMLSAEGQRLLIDTIATNSEWRDLMEGMVGDPEEIPDQVGNDAE